MKPLTISVVIPAYNMEAYIEHTLLSISAQCLLPDEVIIVNDGSTDNTQEIVEKWLKEQGSNINSQLVNKTNGGLSSARNTGIELATGDLIALLDSDDKYHSDFLLTARDAFQAEQGLALFFANQKVVDEHGKKLMQWLENKAIMECQYAPLVGATMLLQESIIAKLVWGNFISCSASVFDRRQMVQHSLYDESIKGGEDVEFLMRFLQDKKVAFTFTELAEVLRHSSSISQSKRHLVHQGRIQALVKNRDALIAAGVDVDTVIKEQFSHCYYQLSLNGIIALFTFARRYSFNQPYYKVPSIKDVLRAIKHGL